jgi:hypothetical protein
MIKTKEQKEILQTLNEIFINNLDFFKKNYPLIYKKVVYFEKSNIENYCINFNNNKFQLTDLVNSINFYKEEPFSDAINRLNNFDITSAFNLIRIETLKEINHYENEINAYEYLNEFIEHFNNVDIKINKLIFLGTLLGVHINDFDKFLKAKVYFIIEPNIEIFRLSMFMTDYKILSENSKVFFAVNEDEQGLNNLCKEFLNYKYEFNNLIHFELAHKINEPLINELSLIFTHLGEMRYPFSEYLISLNRFHNYFIKNTHNLLNLSKTYNFLENKDVLFLGAGPSLEKNLDFVNKNENKFIIVAIAATLKTLETKKIVPDIIITVDGHAIVYEQFNVNRFMYENSIILSSIKLDYKLYKILKDTNIFFFQDSLNFIDKVGFVTGITVGDMGIDILLRLGAKNLYLLGIDAAIDSTGQTHISTHRLFRKINLKEDNTKVNFNKTIIYVKGNFQDFVPTFMEYKEMIEEINQRLEKLDDKTRIYNLSSGAYFNNTIPTLPNKVISIKELNKSDLKSDLGLRLNKISEKDLFEQFPKKYYEEKDILMKINSLKKDETFLDEFRNIQKQYLSSISINILEKYLKLVLPYYNFIKNGNTHKEIFNRQLDEIISKLFLRF